MPRITPLRIVSILPLTWLCLIATWLFIPSPTVSHSSRDALIQSAMRYGHSVTAALRPDPLLSDLEDTRRGAGLLVDWKLEQHYASDSVLLVLGQSARVNLTDAALRGAQYFSAADTQGNVPKPKEQHVPYFSEALQADVRHGELDDFYIMPWFWWVDKLLINYEYRHMNAKHMTYRVYVPEPRVVQIWKNVPAFEHLRNPADIKDTDRERGLLATFSNIPVAQFANNDVSRASIADIVTTNLVGDLPSRTWPIRWMICAPLYVPTFFPLNFIRYFVIGPVTCGLFVVVCVLGLLLKWHSSGRPPFREWIVQLPYMVLCCRTQSRKSRRRGVWGPSGPMADEESGLLGKVPKTAFSTPLSTVFKPKKSRPRVFDR